LRSRQYLKSRFGTQTRQGSRGFQHGRYPF
jgi:hypothetical protein